MNKLFYENYDVLTENNLSVIFEREDYDEDEEELLYIDRGDVRWNLQSEYDKSMPIQVWCNQFGDISYLNTFMIFGMGDVGYVRELMHRYPENRIIIFEPEEEILAKQMCWMNLEDIFTNEKVKIVVGKQRRLSFETTFRVYVSYGDFDNIIYASIPNYTKMFEGEYVEYLKQIKDLVRREVLTRNTLIQREDCRGKDFLYNLELFWKESGIAELGRCFEPKVVEKCPAVLIAAGPSLDKNIQVLKEYQDRVFIVCVDAAIRVAYKYGIKPDLLVSVDPEFKDPSVFDNEYGKNTPIIVALTSDYRVVEKNKARKFYIYEGEGYIDDIIEDTNAEMYGLHSGGSVANTAFSFLHRGAGFKKIILIGQDLGYPDNRLHASDVFYDEKKIDESKNPGYFYVESIDGGQVLTEDNMNMYRLWYENVLRDYPDLTVVDATEGGALIHGTEIMTLRDALEKYTDQAIYEFSSIIEKADYLFTDDEKKSINQKVKRSYEKLDDVIDKLKSAEKIYDKLDVLNRKGKYTSKEFKKCINEISEFHQYTQEESEVELIRTFTNEGEYRVMDDLQAKESNVYDEIKLVVDSGKRLLQSYIQGARKLKKEWTCMKEK